MEKEIIVITTFNGIPWLKKCLDSCQDYLVVVVDNNSTDKTISFIEENYPKVVVLPQSKNLGFGAANNIGISYSLKQGADYVFLLNQDAYLKPKTLEILVSMHKKNPTYGILSPVHINGEENLLDRNFSNYISYDNNSNFYFDAISKQLEPIYEVPFVNAAAWLLPKSTLLKIGGFDPLFFHYGEDDNYCQRVKYHGGKIGVVPNAFVVHDRIIKNKKTVKLFSEEYFIKKELNLKIKWGNLNGNFRNDFNKQKAVISNKIWRSRLKFKFKLVKNYMKELQLFLRIENEIIKSRAINKSINSHYLNE